MIVRALLLALVLLAPASVPAAAACHHYSIWKNPWPQRCGVARQGQIRTISDKLGQAQVRANSRKPDIALPHLTRNDCVGGEADELTRARLELLGYAYAH
jgi:hypothetical protein